MKKYLSILFLILFINNVSADTKENIIQNLRDTNNISFKFEQNINGKIETGNCVIEYPKKIFCDYKLSNQKILVSNGKALVIKTITSYYLYPLEKTSLNLILDKNYLIKKIKNSNERYVDDKFINYTFVEENNELNIFFNKDDYDLVGWQTLDIYQNLNITFLSSVIKNQNLKENLFILPRQN
jgi:outer membrane lipoprotein-sorting protein